MRINMPNKQSSLVWEVTIPLITNPNMVGAWFKAMGATYILCMVLLGVIFIGTGEVESLPMLAGVFALVTLGIVVLGLLIMLLVFGNRFQARFTVSDEGIRYEGIDKRAQTLARIAVMLGAATGNVRTAGAGLLAISQEKVELKWAGAFEARYLPRRKIIVIRNQWRDLMHVFCTKVNYEQVQSRIEQEIGKQGTKERLDKIPSPLPKALLKTLAVLLASIPLFTLNDLADLNIFVPIVIMFFSVAMVWLIPLFAWVVLPMLGYILIHLLVVLLEVREYTLVSTYRYTRFEALDGDEWTLLILVLVSMAYLGWLSIQALRGRLMPVLIQDEVSKVGP